MARHRAWLGVLAAAIVVGGCGGPGPVTITNPNPPADPSEGSFGEPVVRYGNDALLRAVAIETARANLAATVALMADPDAAAVQLEQVSEVDLPGFEARLRASAPQLADRAHADLDRLAALVEAGDARGLRAAVTKFEREVMTPARSIAVPAKARRDNGFRDAVLSATLLEATIYFERALVGGTSISLTPSYATAWGLVQRASDQVSTLPAHEREPLQALLRPIVDDHFPTAQPPKPAPAYDDVEIDIAEASDAALATRDIDTTAPPPADDSPQQLEQVATQLEDLADSISRSGSATPASLAAAARITQEIFSVAPSISVVDPTGLRTLEQGAGVDLAPLLQQRNRTDAATLARSLAATARQTATLLREEIRLLAESE